MRARVLRRRRLAPRDVSERLSSEFDASSALDARHPRRGRRRARCSPRTPADLELVVHTAAQPSHDWAAREPADRLHGQRQRHAEPARGHAPRTRPRPRSCSARRTRSTATCPTRCRCSSCRRGSSCPTTTATTDGIDTTMSIDRSTHSLFGVSKAAADLLVQEYGRYFDMPTVCFRGGCLTGPSHAGARAARVPRLPDAVHRDRRRRTRSTATRASRCATTSTAPTSCAAFVAFHRAPRAGGGLQHRRRPRQQLLDARGDRAVRADRRARAELDALARAPHRRPPLVDLATCARSAPTTRIGAQLRVEEILREIHDANTDQWLATA